MIGKPTANGILIGVLGLAFLIALLTIVLPYTGFYNVSATRDHTALTRWLLDSTMKHSVSSRAEEIEAPAKFSEEMITAGAAQYQHMCQHCHGGPGVEREAWAGGLLPQPPLLTEAASHWQPEELFWIVKHGIKMSGMPAFKQDHADEALWNIVGFVNALPGMTPAKYDNLGGAQPDSHAHSH